MAQAVSAALLQFLWQGAIVGALLAAALAALRRRSAALRYGVCCAALAALVGLPVLTAAALYVRADVPKTAPPLAPDRRAVDLVAVPTPRSLLPIWMTADTPRLSWLARVQAWALPVWSVGVLLLSVRLVYGCARTAALRRRSDPAETPLVELVGRLAARMQIDRPVRLLTSALVEGPGVVGWLRPAILLPPAALMGLTPDQLEAILAHELAHVRRHDWLVNLLQAIAETLLFYHPVVWWTSRQIRLERELCCDDLAVAACGDAPTYAGALAALEERRIGAPRLAVGAAGGSLLPRIQRLLGAPTADQPQPAIALAAAAAALAAALNGYLVGAAAPQEADLRFEVASIKPNTSGTNMIGMGFRPGGQFAATNVTMSLLMRSAYQIQPSQLVGAPGWFDSDRFDIAAKAPEGFTPKPTLPGEPGPLQYMLRNLLADRLKLAVHTETRELPIYALVPARADRKLGEGLKPVSPECAALIASRRGGPSGNAARGDAPPPPPPPPSLGDGSPAALCLGTRMTPWSIEAGSITMAQLAQQLSGPATGNRVVQDRTGLAGQYSVALHWTPDTLPQAGGTPPQLNGGALPAGLPPLDPNGPSLFTALQEQLGLKLESARAPVQVVVIDHVEKPSED